jgi:RNA polymerase sigma-70 factor (ECF subfamily)
MHEESIWITEAKEGDQRAFRALYAANVTSLFRFLKQFSSRTEEVEEWVQRAFIKAFEHLGSFDGRSRFSSWLFTVALNEMRMDRRRAQTISFVQTDEQHESFESATEHIDWNDVMKAWLRDLDETKRAVFILYEVEGYSHAEIASMLGIAESSSRTMLSRAKRFLQDRWNRETAS